MVKPWGERAADRIFEREDRIAALEAALRDLWKATPWGAGKAAAFAAHRTTMVGAGIADIGD